ncbi:MAG: hypothetical protein LBK58_12350 [Prevotellaceae bacterium]|nr:hypothetical protein [Prevotellaceae bacterium]
MIVDFGIFEGEIMIGQLESPPVQESVQWFIDRYEPVFLREQLGVALYMEFVDGLSRESVEDKWITLKDMMEYPAAEYIYCKYMRNQSMETSGVGAVLTDVDTARRVSPWEKIVHAWNDMIDLTQDIHHRLSANPEYPDYCRKKRYSKINSFGL